MNSIVSASITSQIATLTRVARAAVPPLGFGVDLDCVQDCTPYLTEVDPFSTRALGQALIRRITTPRGSVIDDQDYGLDIRSYLNRGVTVSDLNGIGGRIRGEMMKDDRVQNCEVTVTLPSLRTLRVSCEVTPVSPFGNTFDLVFTVSDATLLINTLGETDGSIQLR